MYPKENSLNFIISINRSTAAFCLTKRTVPSNLEGYVFLYISLLERSSFTGLAVGANWQKSSRNGNDPSRRPDSMDGEIMTSRAVLNIQKYIIINFEKKSSRSKVQTWNRLNTSRDDNQLHDSSTREKFDKISI